MSNYSWTSLTNEGYFPFECQIRWDNVGHSNKSNHKRNVICRFHILSCWIETKQWKSKNCYRPVILLYFWVITLIHYHYKVQHRREQKIERSYISYPMSENLQKNVDIIDKSTCSYHLTILINFLASLCIVLLREIFVSYIQWQHFFVQLKLKHFNIINVYKYWRIINNNTR